MSSTWSQIPPHSRLTHVCVWVVILNLIFGQLILLPAHATATTSANTTTSTSTPLPPADFVLAIVTTGVSYFSDALAAYGMEAPDIRAEQRFLTAATAITENLAHRTDASIITTILSPTQAASNPDALMLPLFAYALVPIYNLPITLPDGTAGQIPLRLTRLALARIFSADITWWNSTELATINPGVTLPAEPIRMVMTVSAGAVAWYRALVKFDPTFASKVPSNTAWPFAKYAQTTMVTTLPLTAAGTLSQPYSFSWTQLDTARMYGLSVAALVNNQNATVIADSVSLNYASATIGGGNVVIADSHTSWDAYARAVVNGTALDSPSYLLKPNDDIDLSDSCGSGAWPTTNYVWVLLSRNYSRVDGTCEGKVELMKFLVWLYESETSHELAAARGHSIIAPVLYQALNIRHTLLSLKCTAPLANTSAEPESLFRDDTAFAGANSKIKITTLNDPLSAMIKLFTSAFAQQTQDRSYAYENDVITNKMVLSPTAAATMTDFMVVPLDLLQAQRQMAQAVRLLRGRVGPFVGEESSTSSDQMNSLTILDGRPAAISIPLFILTAIPIFSFPSAVVTRWNAANATMQATRPLVPLKMTLPLLALVLTGQIGSWFDTRLTDLNPNLPYWFGTSSTRITLILPKVGTQANKFSPPLTAAVFHALSTTLEFQLATGFKRGEDVFPTNPMTLLLQSPSLQSALAANGTSSSPRVLLIDNEAQLDVLTALNPGSISFAWATRQRQASDLLAEIQLLQDQLDPLTNDVRQVILNRDPSALTACINVDTITMNSASALDEATSIRAAGVTTNTELLSPLRVGLAGLQTGTGGGGDTLNTNATAAVSAFPQGCYPLAQLRSALLPSSFASKSEVDAKHSLAFLSWLNQADTTVQLSKSMLERGGLFVPSIRELATQSEIIINSVTGGDQLPLLVQLPTIWELSSGVKSFTIALVTIGWFFLFLAFIGLILNRGHHVVRGASLPFMLVVTFGLMLLLVGAFSATFPVSSEVTQSWCDAFLWSTCLGLTLTFAPIVVKIWRVWRIFSQKTIKVQKLTNMTMSVPLIIAVLTDIILLLAWRYGATNSRWSALDESVLTNNQVTVYRHCRLDTDGGDGGLALMLLLACSKAVLLLGAAVLAYLSRKITDAFNESATLAASLYNALLMTAILLPLAVTVVRVGDVVIVLLVIWLLCIAFMTGALTIGSKFIAIGTFHLLGGDGGKTIGSVVKTIQGATTTAVTVRTLDLNRSHAYTSPMDEDGHLKTMLSNVAGEIDDSATTPPYSPSHTTMKGGKSPTATTAVTGMNKYFRPISSTIATSASEGQVLSSNGNPASQPNSHPPQIVTPALTPLNHPLPSPPPGRAAADVISPIHSIRDAASDVDHSLHLPSQPQPFTSLEAVARPDTIDATVTVENLNGVTPNDHTGMLPGMAE